MESQGERQEARAAHFVPSVQGRSADDASPQSRRAADMPPPTLAEMTRVVLHVRSSYPHFPRATLTLRHCCSCQALSSCPSFTPVPPLPHPASDGRHKNLFLVSCAARIVYNLIFLPFSTKDVSLLPSMSMRSLPFSAMHTRRARCSALGWRLWEHLKSSPTGSSPPSRSWPSH